VQLKLHVITSHWPTGLPRDPRPADGLPMILPPIEMHKIREDVHGALGLRRRQIDLVDRLARRDVNTFKRLIHAYERVAAAKRELGGAIDAQRRVMLAILLEHRPAAARRIMKGLARKPAEARS
jgi:hypothetical protein